MNTEPIEEDINLDVDESDLDDIDNPQDCKINAIKIHIRGLLRRQKNT